MGSRAIWTGQLKLGSASIPVKLYAAVQDQDIHFHILDAKTKTRIHQHMVNPDTGEEVKGKDIQKAYEVEKGKFVVLESEELAKLEPKASRDIETLRFISPDEISPVWYERPYYLGPDRDSEPYFALAAALRNENKEGIARWVMRKKPYVGALIASGDYLMLITLRHAEEVLTPSDLPAPAKVSLSQKELKMAEQLVSALEGEFKPEDFRDEYRDRVLNFINSKARGKKPRLAAARHKKGTTSLADDLKRSLAVLKKEKKVA